MRFTTRRRKAWLAIPLAVGLLAAACGDDDDTTTADDSDAASADGGDLSGTILLDGSSTVGPLSEVAAELFMGDNSGVQITVGISGTSGGFEQFCNGETDGNDASRPIKEEEIELCGSNGIEYEGVQVANDALSLVVNADNPLDCITVDQANQIWDEGSDVSSWGDVDGLDIPGDFAGQSLTLYGPGTDSGTFDFFTEAINGEEGVIRIDYNDIGEDDDAAVRGVEGDVGAMGYIPYSYFQEVEGEVVKGLQVDGGDGCVEPTIANVLDGSYTPLGRPLFLYASDVALARPETVAFFEFYIENSDEIAETAGFVPMNDEQKAQSLSQVEALAAG